MSIPINKNTKVLTQGMVGATTDANAWAAR